MPNPSPSLTKVSTIWVVFSLELLIAKESINFDFFSSNRLFLCEASIFFTSVDLLQILYKGNKFFNKFHLSFSPSTIIFPELFDKFSITSLLDSQGLFPPKSCRSDL